MTIQFPKNKKSITLIGMAGAGKTFIGRNLAAELGFEFINTDDIMIEKIMPLQDIVDKYGDQGFIEIEEKTILGLGDIQNKIISPGGSIVYSPKIMDFLTANSLIIYLHDTYEHIFGRVKNLETRGIVGLKDKDFKTLFAEREHLYKKYADITVDMSPMQTEDKEKKAAEVIAEIEKGFAQLNA